MAKYDLTEDDYDVAGARIAIVAARFNAHVVEPLLDGATRKMLEQGVGEQDIDIVKVPGAFEIPALAEALARTNRYDAIVTLGAVIRGGTPHFEYVAGECARGVMAISVAHAMPVIFGVLTLNTNEQALERIGGTEGHKGEEAGLAALEMIHIRRQLAGS
ncbi:MAG: 6,7-dimethyl-8-ribityllumazine synthase [Pseudomonadota bacterium]